MADADRTPDGHVVHPGVHMIALLEAAKGVLALIAASGLELFGPAPLQRAIDLLIHWLGLDPQQGALPSLLRMITPGAIHVAALAIVAYGALRLLEAWGLWRARAWASWLGCLSASIYLPFDLYAIVRYPGWASWAVLAVNLLVVGVLAADLWRRHRLASARG